MPDYTLQVEPAAPFVLDLAELDNDLEAIAAQGTTPYGRQFLNRQNAAEALAHLGLTAKPPFIQSAKPTQHADGSPLALYDRWFSTLDRLWFFWNGTYWLTEQLYRMPIGAHTSALVAINPNGLDYWLESFELAATTQATNNDLNHFVYSLQYRSVSTDVAIASLNTSLAAVSTRFYVQTLIDLHLDVSALNISSIRALQSSVGTPSNLLYVSFCLNHRWAKP